jgi:hypothetical protein
MKVARITQGSSVVPHWAKSGAGELKSSFLMFDRMQQKP